MVAQEHQQVAWLTAAAIAITAVAAAAIILAVVPHLIVSRGAESRELRVAIATGYELVAFVVVAWGARRLQQRRMP